MNWPLIFSSNSGYYFLVQSPLWFKIVLIFKKSTFSIIQMSITSNLEQSVSLVYSLGHWTLKRKRLKQDLKPLPEICLPSILVTTGELVSTNVSIALFWWPQNFISLCYFSFVIYNAKTTCLDCVNSSIYSCILSLLKLHGALYFMN